MSSTGKAAAGGISILGILAFLVHVAHPLFSVYEYNHKSDVPSAAEMQRWTYKQFYIRNMDSLLAIKDVQVRDSLIKDGLKKNADAMQRQKVQ